MPVTELSEKELAKYELYRGFPCVHGHVVRHVHEHWCYACVEKIRNNICGFDISYTDIHYRSLYQNLLAKVSMGDSFNQHWLWDDSTKRSNFPSYRSFYSGKRVDKVSVHKLIYQLAWGDVGNLTVTRICGNKHCLNPLHLASRFNRFAFPTSIHPMDCVIKPEKLLQSFYVPKELVLEGQYKNTIQHPLEVPEELPDYHEDE